MPHDACSEDRLMAFLDGELPERDAREARRHLEACWECRARLADLEKDVHAVARTFRDNGWYAPEDLERSRRRLHAAIASEPAPGPRAGLWRLAPFAAASLVFAGGAVWYATRPAPVAPAPRPVAVRPAAPVIPPPAVAPPAIPAPGPVEQPAVAAPGPNLAETLIDAHEALHRAAVCVRETATVSVRDGRVQVRVLAADAVRRAEIETDLARPGLDLEFVTNDPSNGPEEEVVFVPRSAPEQAGRRIPIHDEVAARVKTGGTASDGEVKEFADAVVRASEAVNLQYQALLTLAEAFPPEMEAKLSANGRDRLRAVAASHEQQLRAAERLLRMTLRPLLDVDGAQPYDGSASWQVETLTSRVPELHRTITRLFGVPLAQRAGEPASLAQLAELLARPLASSEDLSRRDFR